MSVLTLTEREFQERIVSRARARGWLVHHVRPCRTEKGWRTPVQGHSGFPDLTLARPNQLLFRELKTPSGRLTAAQRLWLDVLPDARLWRPNDWHEIEAIIDSEAP